MLQLTSYVHIYQVVLLHALSQFPAENVGGYQTRRGQQGNVCSGRNTEKYNICTRLHTRVSVYIFRDLALTANLVSNRTVRVRKSRDRF